MEIGVTVTNSPFVEEVSAAGVTEELATGAEVVFAVEVADVAVVNEEKYPGEKLGVTSVVPAAVPVLVVALTKDSNSPMQSRRLEADEVVSGVKG